MEPGAADKRWRDEVREGWSDAWDADEHSRRQSFERWFRIAHVFAFVVRLGGLRYVYRPILFGIVVAGVWHLLADPGAVRPEVFALLAGSVPALAIPVFVVLERFSATIDGDEFQKTLDGEGEPSEDLQRSIQRSVAGIGIGMQMLLSETLAISAVATGARSLVLCLVITCCVLAQILWLMAFTFGTVLAPRRVPS